jgi:putative oxidoreductase
MPPVTSSIVRLGTKIATLIAPLAMLATRLVLGWEFLKAGWGKWHDLEKTSQFFASLGIPAPMANAVFIATVELVGGALLILGIGARVAASLLAATMIVALITAHRQEFLDALKGAGEKSLTDVVPFVFLLLLGWLVGIGAGPINALRVIRRRRADPK